MKRDIIDELYAQALRRYKEERPEFNFTNEFADRLWFSIKGKFDCEGEAAAEEYVKNASLL